MNIYDPKILIIAGIILGVYYFIIWRKNKKEKRFLEKFDKIDTSIKIKKE